MRTVRLAAIAALLLTVSVSSSPQAAIIWSMPSTVGAGSTYIYIKDHINPGDEQIFAAVAACAVPPVYVTPSGPGGYVTAALAIGDMIAASGFSTLTENGYKCASACAVIWASGYANHAIARNGSLLYLHSCASCGYDDGDSRWQ